MNRPALPTALPIALLLAALLGGCATQRHEPRPIEPAAEQARWLAADPDDPALRERLAALGADTSNWPLPEWNADALTALALARHPDLAIARAELQRAEAARAAALERGPLGAETTLEHHSADGVSSSPWSLTLVFDALLTGRERRAAQAEAAESLAREAVALAADAAWRSRQRVHGALRELRHAVPRSRASEAALAQQRVIVAALESRLAQGVADRGELLLARRAEGEAQQQASAAREAVAQAGLALAAAVNLPATTLTALRIDTAPAAQAIDTPAIELQRAALLNRIDLRAALARYAAADAALRVELAKQHPELVLKPGFGWDQGDRLWTLGLALQLPPGGRNQAAIAQASAQREIDGARVLALQAAALATLDAARQSLAAARLRRDEAEARWSLAREQLARTERRFDGGGADRIERAAARLAAADAERQFVEAQAAQAMALGALEDAVQQPLEAPARGFASTRAGAR
ncbi:MAG TPA: TolC family protein [Methylibium sp.]|uniref:TolC family protein n=1 Tax=Methylibium sp. TaxID=2067992 RepID=UPI002DB78202|nr:TolC family protein [Methylibium sp.]HEU4460913.1 TolC family protein [Methylibium sp.]